MFQDPVTIINVLDKPPHQIAAWLSTYILSDRLPQYTTNSPVSVLTDIVPRLSRYANHHSFCVELYCMVISAYFEQKKYKRGGTGNFNEDIYTDLEAKKEILYRTMQAVDRLYEAASRLMTGIGEPDPRMNRHP